MVPMRQNHLPGQRERGRRPEKAEIIKSESGVNKRRTVKDRE